MDKIELKGLEIYAYHGVNPEEKEIGQPFVLDIELKADLSLAKESDRLADTVNYAAVRKTVERVFTERKYDLLERVSKVVCDAVLAEHPKVQWLWLCVKKPQAPMRAKFDYVAVKVTAQRTAAEEELCR